MPSEPRRRPRSRPGPALARLWLVAALLAACTSPGTSRPVTAAATRCPPAASAVLRGFEPAELERQRAALGTPPATPLQHLQRAIVLARGADGDLPRAQALVDAVLASRAPDAASLHPLARLLAEQFAERARLEAVADRLTQQLERTGQQLKDSQRRGEELQEKLDALTDIERKLPPRPAAPSLPEPPERRTP